jgi:PAS domain S-box-containing protein
VSREPVASQAAAPQAAAGTARTWTPLPAEFDGLARLAASACQAPLASIVLTGCGEAWSGSGTAAPRTVLPSHDPFYEYTLRAPGVFEVPNTQLDKRFCATDCVKGKLAVRSYAGCALRSARGEVLGAIAVYGAAARQLSAEQRAALSLLAQQCVTQTELRARVAELELLGSAQPGTPAEAAPAAPTASPAPRGDSALAHALMESAPVAIYHADGTSALNYVNPEYRRVFGLAPEQSVDDWAQGVHPEDRARMEATWADFCRQPRPMRFEYRTLPRNGVVRFFAEQVVPVAGRDGFVGTISDFTDLVTARGDLHRAETLFRNTFDQAPIGIAYMDRSGRFLRFNDAFCALLGYASPDLTGKSLGDLTHDEDAAVADAQLERLWAAEIQFVDLEKRYLRRDGSYLWVRTTTALVRDGSSTECSVEYVRDITQRKQLAAALLQQQTLLEAVITDLPVALLVCDVAGNITHYNRAAVDLYCIQPHDPACAEPPDPYPLRADVYLSDGLTPVPRAERPLACALRGETISNLELVIAPRDSRPPRTTLSNARRLVGPNGETLGAVAVIQDTTERRHQELELERVHKELMLASRQAGMAEVATNVLHNVGNILNSVNISASLVAERVRQSKAPGVSRLAAMLLEQGAGAGQFISSDERGKRVPEYLAALGEQLMTDQRMALEELASLRDNLEHIKDTVAMQQNYAKLCGVTEVVEVIDLVEDSLRLNAGAFARHGVTLKREFGEVPQITVDKHKVLQILVNLIRNAKYACDETGRSDKLITLRIERTAHGVRISVIDNGVGIPAENMRRLFSHGFTTRKSGHGFGLHSGALAAQELGGTLHAESEGAGHGAAFILELPLVAPDAARG